MEIRLQANPIFKEPDRTKKRYVVLKGSAGSGKSMDTAQHYILRLLTEPGRNLLCVRKVDTTNRDSTFAELTAAIYRIHGQDWEKYWKINQSNLNITCLLNRNKILFRGCKDDRQREKLKSITVPYGNLTDVWIEEATELTKNDFEIIDDRLRGELPEGQFYQIRMTFNPVSASHWIKRDFFDHYDNDVFTHHSTYRDNRFIDQAYYRRMERRKEVDPQGYQIYGLGEWGETKGLILSNWEILEEFDTDFSHYDDIAIGQDFGFNHADAIYPFGYKDGNIYVFPGIYEYEKDTSELIQIANRKGIPKDRIMWCDSAEPDRIQMWKKAGFDARPVRKEQSATGKKYQAVQIDWLKGIPEKKTEMPVQRKIFIHPSNVNFIKEIQQWKWKYDDRRDIYYDEPVEYMDDAMAALRYGIEGWRKPREKARIKSFKF